MGCGRFISFEGIDGCGKSTQIHLLAERLQAAGYAVELYREPGSTDISEQIRAMLLDPAYSEMAPTTELLLYEAARAQLVAQKIRPALESGTFVLCDRYADSTVAYQAAGRDLDVQVVCEANQLGTCGLWPDTTILLDINPSVAYSRVRAQGAPDRLEAEGVFFQTRVREGFRELAQKNSKRVCMVDAAGSQEAVFSEILQILRQRGLDLG